MDIMTSKHNYQEMIIKFNSDKDIIALKEKYKEPTFFEIISKQRSETTYSSFLKWLLQSSGTDLGTVSPILLLLDVLVAKSKNTQIADDIKRHIITRDFKINDIQVETEKSVSSVAAALDIKNNSLYQWGEDDIQKIIAKCQDRIDVFISCDIEFNDEDDKARKLQIVIENKIDSGEGKGKKKTGVESYDNAIQTQRYHYATALKNSEYVTQLYVYLAPVDVDKCELDDVYIQINYQDIVDGIILPMLASSSLSLRQRFFLEEFKTELTFPSLESTKVRNSIANSMESTECFKKIWDNHKALILDAAICSIESDIYLWADEYVCRPNNKELLEKCKEVDESRIPEKWLKKLENIRVVFGSNEKNDFDELLKDLKLQVSSVRSMIADEDADKLLEPFWNNNQKFLLAVMSGVKDDNEVKEKEVIEQLLGELSKRDTTKYQVFYNNKCLNELLLDGKDANNGETAWLIINAWLKSMENDKVDLEKLNEVFTPDKCNSYYSNGKWLKNLFYEYNKDGKYTADGTQSDGSEVKAGGWDFYKPKDDNDLKFQFELSDGTKVIMLKMWRKNNLKILYEYVKKSTGMDIDIQPAL